MVAAPPTSSPAAWAERAPTGLDAGSRSKVLLSPCLSPRPPRAPGSCGRRTGKPRAAGGPTDSCGRTRCPLLPQVGWPPCPRSSPSRRPRQAAPRLVLRNQEGLATRAPPQRDPGPADPVPTRGAGLSRCRRGLSPGRHGGGAPAAPGAASGLHGPQGGASRPAEVHGYVGRRRGGGLLSSPLPPGRAVPSSLKPWSGVTLLAK